MERWNDLAAVPPDVGPCVVTLGNFDGVHAGHRAVLTRLVERARAENARAVAVTFDPHPLRVLYPDRAPEMITGLDQRLELVGAVGLDAVLVMPFTHELAQWTPEEFVSRVYVDVLHARAVVLGRASRSGRRTGGDDETRRALGARFGCAGAVGAHLAPSAGGRRWSSSWVRELLERGDVDAAAGVLGRPHRVTGEVVHGDHRGRELGYPTANLSPHSEGLVPADGVYAGWLLRAALPEGHPDRLLPAAVSIGTNPTFHGTGRRVEAYVLDRTDLDLYGETVTLELVGRLRPTLRFDDVQELVDQMALDVEECRRLLGEGVVPRTQPVGGLDGEPA